MSSIHGYAYRRGIHRGVRLHRVLSAALPFVRRGHIDGLARKIRIGINPRDHRARRARPFAGRAPLAAELRERGFATVGPAAFEGQAEALRVCARLFEERLSDGPTREPKKSFLIAVADEKRCQRELEIMRLAVCPDLIAIAADYLEEVPLVSALRLWWTPPNRLCESSQLFHCDSEDDRQVKAFFYLETVDHDCGPLTVIPRATTRRAVDALDYVSGRLDDEVLERVLNLEEAHAAVGEAGFGILADTSACLHRGSRAARRDRLALMIQYTRSSAPKADVPRWRLPLDFLDGLDEDQLAVLGMDLKRGLRSPAARRSDPARRSRASGAS